MSDDLFDENNKPKDEGTPTKDDKSDEGASSENTYLSLILNENGEQKYATTEEALKGTVHAQSHITKLESELKELRDKADKGVSAEQILEALNKNKKPDDKSGEQENTLTADDIAAQVENILTKRESETTVQKNVATVTGIFNKLYGDKASETLYSKAEDLGFSKAEINQMVSTNPKATLKILGVTEAAQQKADPVTDASSIALDLSSGKPEEKPATIMGATNSDDLTDAWKKSKEATNKRLGGVETLS